MAKIVGSISPQVSITELPTSGEPMRAICLSDTTGRVHGSVTWIASEVDEDFLAELAVLAAIGMKHKRSTHSPSASA